MTPSLRDRLQSPAIVLAPGVYDALSAHIAQHFQDGFLFLVAAEVAILLGIDPFRHSDDEAFAGSRLKPVGGGRFVSLTEVGDQENERIASMMMVFGRQIDTVLHAS